MLRVLLISLFSLFCIGCDDPTWEARVLSVDDGDTITVLRDGEVERVRLHGIDCPESGQPWGRKAARFLRLRVGGETVEVDPVAIDRYDRVVAWVRLDGENINAVMLKKGLAWWDRKHAGDDDELGDLQDEAIVKKAGLWSQIDPIPPWKYRREQRR